MGKKIRFKAIVKENPVRGAKIRSTDEDRGFKRAKVSDLVQRKKKRRLRISNLEKGEKVVKRFKATKMSDSKNMSEVGDVVGAALGTRRRNKIGELRQANKVVFKDESGAKYKGKILKLRTPKKKMVYSGNRRNGKPIVKESRIMSDKQVSEFLKKRFK